MFALSADFRDLLARMLAKHPSDRITWGGLVEHSFWNIATPPVQCELPAQPGYEKFLRKHSGMLPRIPIPFIPGVRLNKNLASIDELISPRSEGWSTLVDIF